MPKGKKGRLTSNLGSIDMQKLAGGIYQLLKTDLRKNETIVLFINKQ